MQAAYRTINRMPATLSRETMLSRMLAADPAFDGQFITGVTSTGIYCLPSCRARKPRPQNVVFYRAPAQARAAGLRPCQRCKPDDFYAGIDGQEELVQSLLSGFRPQEVSSVRELAGQAQVSQSKLHDLFRHYLHRAPADWMAQKRVDLAREQLLLTEKSVAEIAFEVGFESLSAFNEQFSRRCGLSPMGFRKLPDAQPFTLRLPTGMNVPALLRDLGRDPQQTTLRVTGDPVNGSHVTAALRLPGGPRLLHLIFRGGQVNGRISPAEPLSAACTLSLHTQLLRMLGWHSETRRFEQLARTVPDLARLLAGQEGTPLPLTPDPFDGLVWAMLGQQVSFKAACTLRRRLLERVSERLPEGFYAPPAPQALAGLRVHEVQALGLPRARAEGLIHAASLTASGALDLPALANGTAPRAEKTLRSLPGIGPWTANYVLIRALGFQDAVPVGDSALASALQDFFGLAQRPDARKTADLMQPFAPYRSLATFYLWHRSALTKPHALTRPHQENP